VRDNRRLYPFGLQRPVSVLLRRSDKSGSDHLVLYFDHGNSLTVAVPFLLSNLRSQRTSPGTARRALRPCKLEGWIATGAGRFGRKRSVRNARPVASRKCDFAGTDSRLPRNDFADVLFVGSCHSRRTWNRRRDERVSLLC